MSSPDSIQSVGANPLYKPSLSTSQEDIQNRNNLTLSQNDIPEVVKESAEKVEEVQKIVTDEAKEEASIVSSTFSWKNYNLTDVKDTLVKVGTAATLTLGQLYAVSKLVEAVTGNDQAEFITLAGYAAIGLAKVIKDRQNTDSFKVLVGEAAGTTAFAVGLANLGKYAGLSFSTLDALEFDAVALGAVSLFTAAVVGANHTADAGLKVLKNVADGIATKVYAAKAKAKEA